MSNHVIRRSLFVAAAALSVAAVGCGATGGDPGGDAQIVSSGSSGVASQAAKAAGVVAAAETTGSVDTLRFSMTVETTPTDGGRSLSITSTGAVDAVSGRTQVTADLAAAIGDEPGSATVEAVGDREAVYVKAPFTDVLADTPWVKLTSPKLAELADELGAGLDADPGSFLELLEGAGGPVTTIGTEDVRGVATRHVAVDLDVTKVLDQADPGHRDQLEAKLRQRGLDLAELGPLPAEAWIDDDGFVRRFTVSFDLAQLSGVAPDAEASGVLTETIELYDLGEPVDIVLPPADQVTELDVTDLLGGSGSGD